MPGAPILLVGLMEDLRADEGVVVKLKKQRMTPVSYAQGLAMANKIGANAYVECSALTQRGLRSVFKTAVKLGLGVFQPCEQSFASQTQQGRAVRCHVTDRSLYLLKNFGYLYRRQRASSIRRWCIANPGLWFSCLQSWCHSSGWNEPFEAGMEVSPWCCRGGSF